MRIFLIINPKRRTKWPPAETVGQIRQELDQHGCDYEIELSESIPHAHKLIDRAAKEGYDTLWIGGGDGTINQLLNYSYGKGFTYGIIPMGTINAFARAVGIPTDPVEAVRYLLESEPADIDVVRVNGRLFLCYASVGIHAQVMHWTDAELKKRYGKFAFYISGFRAAWNRQQLPLFKISFKPEPWEDDEHTGSRRFPSAEEFDGDVVHKTGYSLILSNVCNYVGFGVVRDTRCLSAHQELHLFRKRDLTSMWRWFFDWRFDDGYIDPKWGVEQYRISECVLESQEPLSIQIDGEPVTVEDPHRLHFECLRHAVKVLMKTRVEGATDESRLGIPARLAQAHQ